MPMMPGSHRPPGARARVEANREHDQRRGSAASRGYTGAWAKAADGHRRRHPLCRYCELAAFGGRPRVSPAELVDHLYPHKGDRAVFWLRALWVSCCKACHDGPKQAAERRGQAALDALARAIGLPTLAAARGEGVVETLEP